MSDATLLRAETADRRQMLKPPNHEENLQLNLRCRAVATNLP
jgi:hypothetical protein